MNQTFFRSVRTAALAAWALSFSACGVLDGAPFPAVEPEPDPTSAGTFEGRVSGQHLDGQDTHVRLIQDALLGEVLALEIVDYFPSCADYTAGREHKNSLHLTLLLGLKTSGGVLKPTAAGPYNIFNESLTPGAPPPPGAFSIARFSTRDGTCGVVSKPEWSGASGTVTIGSISLTLGSVQGTYELKMGTGDTIKGRFLSVACAEPSSGASSCL
jgi:hypothetical protein